jgi:hypothetical protein
MTGFSLANYAHGDGAARAGWMRSGIVYPLPHIHDMAGPWGPPMPQAFLTQSSP